MQSFTAYNNNWQVDWQVFKLIGWSFQSFRVGFMIKIEAGNVCYSLFDNNGFCFISYIKIPEHIWRIINYWSTLFQFFPGANPDRNKRTNPDEANGTKIFMASWQVPSTCREQQCSPHKKKFNISNVKKNVQALLSCQTTSVHKLKKLLEWSLWCNGDKISPVWPFAMSLSFFLQANSLCSR